MINSQLPYTMITRNTQSYLLLPWLLLTCLTVEAQTIIKQDSLLIEQGVAGTNDFDDLSRKLILAHDDDGRPLEILTESFTDGEWRPRRKVTLSYEQGRISNTLIQVWNPLTETFQDSRERILTYGPNNQLLSRVDRQAPSPGEALVNDQQWLHTYDDDEQLLLSVLQAWDGGSWEDLRRRTYAYNANGQLIEQVAQVWAANDWRNLQRRSMSYDPMHFGMTVALGQQWSPEEQSWVNVQRMTYTYNAQNNWSSEVTQVWDQDNEAWVSDHRQLFTMGPQGQFEGRVRQVWEDDQWRSQFRGAQTFNGQLLNIQFEGWQEDTQSWENHSRHFLHYGADGRLALSQGWERWNSSSEQWENDLDTRRYRFFWSALITATEETPIINNCRVPNPYLSGQVISCNLPNADASYTLELFDLLGRRIYRATFTAGEDARIDRSFPQGTYVLRIRQNDKIYHLQQLLTF